MGKILKEYYGAVQVRTGNEVWVNTSTDERVVLGCKDWEKQCELYCNYVRITVEEVPREEVIKHFEQDNPKK